MLETIIAFLNQNLLLTNYFDRRFGLSELVIDGAKTYPKFYCEDGEWRDIFNIDYKEGISYWRKTGQTTTLIDEAQELVACDEQKLITYSLLLVGIVPKSKLTKDYAYSKDRIVTTLTKQLSNENVQNLQTLLQAYDIDIEVNSADTITSSIMGTENPSGEIVDLDAKYAVVSLAVTVSISIADECIIPECDQLLTDPLQGYDFCKEDVRNRLTQEQIDCINQFICSPIDELTCEQLNNVTTGLTNVQRQVIQHVHPLKTGRAISVLPGDDGDLEEGRGVNFTTLDCNNVFGNTNRYTDRNGLQVYGDDYVIDHMTGKGWYRVFQAATTWDLAIGIVNAGLNLAGFTDWYFPNINEMQTIYNFDGGTGLNYPGNPWGSPGIWSLWSSTLEQPNVRVYTLRNSFGYQLFNRASNVNYIVIRDHF